MKRASDKITDTIASGKRPRRIGKSRVINLNDPSTWDGQGVRPQRWVAAPHEREADIARRIQERANG